MNQNKIKLIALDIDGTIMNKEFRISDTVKNTINKAIQSGIKVVLATGRMYSATVPIANELGITTPLITYQGSLIQEYNKSNDILLHHTLSPEMSLDVISELRKYNTQINVYLNDELFIEDESALLKEYATKRHIVYHNINSFEKVADLKPTKIIAIDNDLEKIDKIRDHLKAKYDGTLYVTKSTSIYCEFVNVNASKGNAIMHLANQWDIKASEIMVVGDQDNDKEMLSMAGTSVAMGNATPGLKEIASHITDTVDNDGAAKAIQKFALS